jgi:hypothetical protein
MRAVEEGAIMRLYPVLRVPVVLVVVALVVTLVRVLPQLRIQVQEVGVLLQQGHHLLAAMVVQA